MICRPALFNQRTITTLTWRCPEELCGVHKRIDIGFPHHPPDGTITDRLAVVFIPIAFPITTLIPGKAPPHPLTDHLRNASRWESIKCGEFGNRIATQSSIRSSGCLILFVSAFWYCGFWLWKLHPRPHGNTFPLAYNPSSSTAEHPDEGSRRRSPALMPLQWTSGGPCVFASPCCNSFTVDTVAHSFSVSWVDWYV